MNLEDTHRLLQLISDYDRRPFSPSAIELWAPYFARIDYADAEAAVHKIFRMHPRDDRGTLRTLLPADVARPARDIADSRRRKAAQRAIASAHRPPQERSPAASAAVERARAIVAAAEARYREQVHATAAA